MTSSEADPPDSEFPPRQDSWRNGPHPPANLAEEIKRYDETATVSIWSGPRYRMIYRVMGDGPPLLWVPGIASTHRVYSILLNRLARRFRTIQYTYPGDVANDGANLGQIRHEHLVDDLFGLLDHLGIDQAVLAGISFGSTVTLAALARDGGRIPGAILQGGFAWRRFTSLDRLALRIGGSIAGNSSRLPLRRLVLRLKSRRDFPRPIVDRWPIYVKENGLTPIPALSHRTRLLAGLDLRPRLADIKVPLLLLQGEDDRIVPRASFEELKSGLPEAHSLLFSGVGHIPHLSHPEQFADLIKRWFAFVGNHEDTDPF